MREITVAVAQFSPVPARPEENLVQISGLIGQIAGQQKVDIIVFPELITTGNELGVRFTDVAQRVPGPIVNVIAQRAHDFGVYVAFGMATKERVESVLYNSAVLIGPSGELVDVYHKLHLRGEERMAFREGYKLPVAETELGTFGLMLGYDLAYPEVARSLALQGSELVFVLGNWEAQYSDEWETYLRARAYENSFFIAGANRIGEEFSKTFGGHSMIIGPRGEIYASMADRIDEKTGEPKAGYAIARFDLDEVRQIREEFQFMQTRQPTAYRAVVRKY